MKMATGATDPALKAAIFLYHQLMQAMISALRW
jgi:hypothetical protein